MNSGDKTAGNPRGVTAFGIFLLLGSVMASLAGTSLVWRGTALDHMWALNPRGYKQLAPLGNKAGILMLLVACVLLLAGIGWFKRRYWGWRLAVAIIATHIAGDLVNLSLGRVIEGSVGIAAACALLLYLWRAPVRAVFRGDRAGNDRS